MCFSSLTWQVGYHRKGSGEVNLILLTVILSCVILLMLGVIGVMLCLVKMYKDEVSDLEDPLLPPVKSWVDSVYEYRY